MDSLEQKTATAAGPPGVSRHHRRAVLWQYTFVNKSSLYRHNLSYFESSAELAAQLEFGEEWPHSVVPFLFRLLYTISVNTFPLKYPLPHFASNSEVGAVATA